MSGSSSAQSSVPARQRGLQAAIEPIVTAAGYDLESLHVTAAGRRSVVKVVVDGDDGIHLDDVALLSRTISAALDDADPLGATPYTLEVTSPGVDRPLTEPRHWRRAVGRLVAVPVAGRPTEGRIVAADADGIDLEVSGQQIRCALADLGAGRVQVEFSRKDPAAAEGSGKQPTAKQRRRAAKARPHPEQNDQEA